MNKISHTNKIVNYFIIILSIGFLFSAVIPKLFGLSDQSLNVQYRMVVLGWSILSIITIIFSSKLSKLNLKPFLFFFIFWLIYLIRILYDLYINPILLYPDTSSSQYLQLAFGVTFIPSLALVLVVQVYKIDYTYVLKRIYLLLLIILIVLLFFRAGNNYEGRTVGDVNIGVIIFGHYGATLSILSVYSLFIKKNNYLYKLYYILGFIIGCITIFVSASKSPFVALTLVITIFFILRYGSAKSLLILFVIWLILKNTYIDIAAYLNNYFNSNFIDRLLYSIDSGEDKARENLINAAFSEFIDNPFIGKAFLIQKVGIEGSYPHNLIVESLMATGFIGSVMLIIYLSNCLIKSYKLIKFKNDNSWIALIFLQYLILGMFSKNLYANDLFWIFSLLVIQISNFKLLKSY